jgi:predicted DNA-binding transcriptional regulator AlpA
MDLQDADPDQVVRWSEGPRYFGVKKSQLSDAINKGLIPTPFRLVEGGRAKGWTRRQIAEHHQSRVKASSSGQK